MRRPIDAVIGAEFDKAWESAQLRAVDQHLTLSVRLATPMLGGGVKAGQIDETCPISGKGIRGQLRFWWRTVSAAVPRSVEQMALWEETLFGSARSPSPFDVVVSDVRTLGKRAAPPSFGLEGLGGALYALFAARQGVPALWKEGLQFSLSVRYPNAQQFDDRRRSENESRARQGLDPLPGSLHEVRSELETALWAWLNFGGLGSRTRRGLGAVWVDGPNADRFSLLEDGTLRHTIAANIYVGPPAAVLEAWNGALDQYRKFRQHRSRPRGRSLWPEPDSIRRITGCHAPAHPPVSASGPNAFPRATLGLPIIFWFKGSPDDPRPTGLADRNREPVNSSLVPFVLDADGETVRGNRMASPIVTRPLRIGGAWCQGIVVLDRPDRNALRAHLDAHGMDATGRPGATPYDVPCSQIADPLIPALHGKDDAVSAFVESITADGFTELPR